MPYTNIDMVLHMYIFTQTMTNTTCRQSTSIARLLLDKRMTDICIDIYSDYDPRTCAGDDYAFIT